MLNNDFEVKSRKILHPDFYKCFDWHSSVHGHWLMIRLLKEFPDFKTTSIIPLKPKKVSITGDHSYFVSFT